MITKNDLEILYNWAKAIEFPVKKAPTIDGYSNKDSALQIMKDSIAKVIS